MIKVKICGISNEQDALWAVNLGADYIGINFWKESPRHVSSKQGAAIAQKIPQFVRVVGIFVNEDPVILKKTLKQTGITMVQLHGQESPEFCRQLRSEGLVVVKAVRVADDSSLGVARAYTESADYLLLDGGSEAMPGGTGQIIPWDIASKAGALGIPFFLAGGLTPENVHQAIVQVKPFAVDVASGVEKSPKRKDYEKMKKFMAEAKGL